VVTPVGATQPDPRSDETRAANDRAMGTRAAIVLWF
jgi:hypothetical protein